MSQKKDIGDFSMDELKHLAKEAGLEAQEESLKAGIEIMSEDEEGNLVYEKLDENGKVVTKLAELPTTRVASNADHLLRP